jgi:hypothetical protein
MKAYHLTLSVAAMLFCLVLAPAVSFAGDWGAIALSTRTGAWGSSWNYDEEGDARSAALRECRKHAGDCRVFKTFENACVALAGDGGATLAGPGVTTRPASGVAEPCGSAVTKAAAAARW